MVGLLRIHIHPHPQSSDLLQITFNPHPQSWLQSTCQWVCSSTNIFINRWSMWIFEASTSRKKYFREATKMKVERIWTFLHFQARSLMEKGNNNQFPMLCLEIRQDWPKRGTRRLQTILLGARPLQSVSPAGGHKSAMSFQMTTSWQSDNKWTLFILPHTLWKYLNKDGNYKQLSHLTTW